MNPYFILRVLYGVFLGVLFMVSALFLPLYSMFVLLIGGVGVLLVIGYVVARREYELEDISDEAPEKPGKSIEPPRLGKYLATQLVFAFLLLLMSPELPRDVTVVLGSVMALFIALTLLASRPLVFQLAPKFSGIMARGLAKALTLVSAFITFEAFLVWRGFEGDLLGILLIPIALLVIFYAAYVMLTSAYGEGYY